MKLKRAPCVFWLLPLLALAACAPSLVPTSPAQPARLSMTFMAGYKPQANLPFVGVYLAQAKGFFEAERLDVTVEHSSGRGEHMQLLTAGKAQVTTQDAGVLLQRRLDPGLPLVSIALIGQRGQQAFVALASSGLKTPQDWPGHTIGYKGTPPPELLALMKANGLNPQALSLVNVGFDPRVLVTRQVDVYPVYKSNEPYLIRQWGYDLVQWDAADYGVPSLGLAYVATEEVVRTNPELLTRFLRASLQGIRYAAEHPDEAVDAVLQYTGPETDRNHMRFMLEAELADAQTDLTRQHGLGWQTREQWQGLADMLVQTGALSKADVASAFTTRLLELAANQARP
ncbi:MAG: ABC transporter substrate-binding protein [Anaerolineae bacterium]|nr:ABC transporter substrate-binding protein [Anaerolineae bacterium]